MRCFDLPMASGWILAYVLVACGAARAERATAVPSPVALPEVLAARPLVNGPLSLAEAERIARESSPVVRGAVEEVEAATGRLEAARAERRPWVSLNLFGSGGSNGNVVAGPMATQPQMIMSLPPGGFVDGNLMLMYPLYTSGRLTAMVRQAASLRDASRADLEAQTQEVVLLTRTAYREVQARRSLVEVARAKLADDEERLRVDRTRLQEGQLANVYVLRDEAEVAASQQELTNATRDAELSLLQLKTVLGINPASQVEVAGALEFVPSAEWLVPLVHSVAVGQAGPAEADEASALLRLAGQRRPELQAALLRTAAARSESATVRGGYGPQVTLFAMGDTMKQEGEPSFSGVTYGVAASFPLYNGGQRRARLQTAAAEQRRQEEERQRISLQVTQEVSSALLNLRAAEQNVGTSRAAVTAAREEYRVQSLRYRSGRSVLVEVLDALSARTRAEAGVTQALFEYNVARDRLLRAIGGLVGPIGNGPK